MDAITRTTRTALITGASSGIGMALAECFAADGWDVVLAARGVDKMETLAARLRQTHGIAVTVVGADLETAEGASRLHAAVTERGIVLDALVNNAGFGDFGEFKDTDLARDLGMIQLNMATVVVLTKLFLPDLIARRGKILNIASTAAFQPGPYMAVYYASKAFVLHFSEAIAEELAPSGVTVTALCPGPTESRFVEAARAGTSALFKGRRLPSAESVAAIGYRATMTGRRVVIPGAMNWIMAQSVRFSPRRVVTWLVKTISRPVR